MTLTYEQKVFIWASGHFLDREVDQYFFYLDYDAQFKYLEDNAWQPFENYSGNDIHAYIFQLANDVIMKRVPEEVAQ